MRTFNELRETTNSSVYKKLRKRYYAPWPWDPWHGHNCDNDAWPVYYTFIGNSKEKGKFPNWKLVSKNKRQWMKKSLRIKASYGGYPYRYDSAPIKWSAYHGRERYYRIIG